VAQYLVGAKLAVRRLVHAMGYRYRLHMRRLPGCPDLVFPCRRKVIFVHGCFWHQHRCKRGNRVPSSGRGYWLPKLRGNRHRDQTHRAALRRLGWDVLVVWECHIQEARSEQLEARIRAFLGPRVGVRRYT
jgi:DNA mismatch endonuclease (patch repair protein)